MGIFRKRIQKRIIHYNGKIGGTAMKYNIIKIFVIGSTKLEKQRKYITDAANEITTSSIIGKDDTKNIICIYSFENTGQEQEKYNHIIEHEADAVIAVIEDEFGGISYDELKLAKETHDKTHGTRPLLYGLKHKNANPQIKIGEETIDCDYISKNLLNKYFKSYSSKDLEKHAKEIINEIVGHFEEYGMPKPEKITWQNDSFAYMTIEARFKENYRIVAENFEGCEIKMPEYGDFEKRTIYNKNQDTVNKQIESALKELLKCHDLRDASGCSDVITHKELFRNYPFLIVEFYFYYYILYLYHEKKKISNTIEDPYKVYKRRNLYKDIEKKNFISLLNAYRESLVSNDFDELEKLVMGCLNMNSIDLSQLEVNVGKIESSSMPINDSDRFCSFVKNKLSGQSKNAQVHIITDNCGLELISDILIGSYLIRMTEVSDVVFHIKKLPIFVSDTIMSDVDDAIDVLNDKLNGSTEFILTKDSTGERTYKCHDINDKTLIFKADDIWHRETLFKDVAEFETWNSDDSCALIIVKGDLNYRRLVGDYHWHNSVPIADKVSYIRKPLLIIRSLKSNVILDVKPETVKTLDKSAPNWKISGQHGIIQFLENR